MSSPDPARLFETGAAIPTKLEEEGRVTPMMAQYIEIKGANPGCLLFYRMGDFYELFFEDAETASRALGIVLTKRGKHQGRDIPMCGVPIDRADDYLNRLISLGHRVAVCEQTEDPGEARKRGPKEVVRRAVVRLVTPGTLTEERLLDPGRSNLFVAVSRTRSSEEEWIYGLAALDISTGAFVLSQSAQHALSSEIARFEPREIIVCEPLGEDERVRSASEDWRAPLTVLPREGEGRGERRLRDWYGVATLDGFGQFSRSEIAAAGTALAYVERTQIGAKPALDPPTRREAAGLMQIDAATRANLELTRTLAGERAGSLLSALDLTCTPAGSRLLAERLASPSAELEAIVRRLDAVSYFLRDGSLRAEIRKLLRSAPDLARALARLAVGRGGPRDLAALEAGMRAAFDIQKRLAGTAAIPTEVESACRVLAELDREFASILGRALVDEPPLERRAGGFIRPGHVAELDEARTLRDETRRVIAGLQARYCDLAGSKQLKVKHNNFLGYFVEVAAPLGEQLLRAPFDEVFRHRQTMAESMRFSTAELVKLEAEIASASDRALALELGVFEELAGRAVAHGSALKGAADALARLDVACALSETAALDDWTRPQVDNSLAFKVEAGRHPVVEAALKAQGKPFVANDCDLSADGQEGGRIAVMTGPNMAGKSTFLRQNALIAVLAQAGSFVPARCAHVGLVDRLFSRVGAADDLARGRSTFMVEMVETAAILNQASPRSLVILDEIGRGTSTFDGLSIAWASAEHLHDKNRSRTLFATHFHELTQLAGKLPRLLNLTMRVSEWRGDVVFLHEVAAGAADRSYGVQVARLAGLPASVVKRAKELLAQLEAGARGAPIQALLDDLPLFSASPRLEAKEERLRTALEALELDAMSPRAALEALYDLRSLSRPD